MELVSASVFKRVLCRCDRRRYSRDYEDHVLERKWVPTAPNKIPQVMNEIGSKIGVRDSGAYDYGVEELVNEVVATGKAAKRNVLLKPVGGSMSFKCAICASPELDEEGTILGFEIFESYDASADTRGMDQS